MYNSRKDLMNILSHADFAKLCNAIKYFPECNKFFVKEVFIFLFCPVQEPLNVKINILMN